MTDNNELTRLEEIIDNLLNRYGKLEEENRKNLATIEARNEEIEELQQKLAGLEKEKEQVQERVSGILKSIEEWEGRERAGGNAEEIPAEDEEGTRGSEEEWPKLFGTES